MLHNEPLIPEISDDTAGNTPRQGPPLEFESSPSRVTRSAPASAAAAARASVAVFSSAASSESSVAASDAADECSARTSAQKIHFQPLRRTVQQRQTDQYRSPLQSSSMHVEPYFRNLFSAREGRDPQRKRNVCRRRTSSRAARSSSP